MKKMRGASFAGSSPQFLGREVAAVDGKESSAAVVCIVMRGTVRSSNGR